MSLEYCKNIDTMYENVIVEILEQPDSTPMKFRYLSESGCRGVIFGVNSADKVNTYPRFRVLNYDGSAFVIVSCVTNEEIPKPHPNTLTGSKKCAHGVYRTDFTTRSAEPTVVELCKVTVRLTKKELIEQYLDKREDLRIDPFKTGFGHKHNVNSIDMHRVRLCLQVYLKPDHPKQLIPLEPITSNVIVDIRSFTMLTIYEMSDISSPAEGGKLIMICCERVDKRNVGIKFYEKDSDGNTVWEEHVKPKKVHKQVGISFFTPRYKSLNIDQPVNVFFCLETLAGEPKFGASKEFQYIPYPDNVEQALSSEEHNASILSYDFMEINETDNLQKSVSHRKKIDNSTDCIEDIDPANGDFWASNFDTSTNNSSLPHSLQPQQYDNLQIQPEQQCQPHRSDYEWAQYEEVQQMHFQKQFSTSQCQQQHQCIEQTEDEMDPNYNSDTPNYNPYTDQMHVENDYGRTNTFSHDINRQPVENYQHPVESIQYPCQQEVGPVYAADEVINQSFTGNYQVAEVLSNLSDYCLSSDSSVQPEHILNITIKRI